MAHALLVVGVDCIVGMICVAGMEVDFIGADVGLPWVAIELLVDGTLQATRTSSTPITNKDERLVFKLLYPPTLNSAWFKLD